MEPVSGDRPARRTVSTDVARLAGVSHKTVSRVMNAEAHVRPELRERVLRAARDLGYRPNAAARSLVSGRTRRLGVVTLGARLHGPTSQLIAAETTARALGYATTVAHTTADDHDVAGSVEWLLGQGVDGLVLTEDLDEGSLALRVDVPVLAMGRFPGLDAPHRVAAAEGAERFGRVATRHLIDLGHTEIRHLAGPPRWWASRDRAAGWRAALAEAGLVPVPPLAGDWSCESGYVAGRRLAADTEMTAVFVANDDMAIGLVRALELAGRRVPHDVSVVGMDDIPAARFLNPSLTTIAQDFDEVVADGIRKLVREIKSPGTAQHRLLDVDPRLVVRESTAPR